MGFKSHRTLLQAAASRYLLVRAGVEVEPHEMRTLSEKQERKKPRGHAEKKTFDSKYSQLSNGFRNPVRVTFLTSARDGAQRNRTPGFSPGFRTRVIFYASPFHKIVFTPRWMYFRRDHGKNVDFGEKLARFLRQNGIRHGRFMRKHNGEFGKSFASLFQRKKKNKG